MGGEIDSNQYPLLTNLFSPKNQFSLLMNQLARPRINFHCLRINFPAHESIFTAGESISPVDESTSRPTNQFSLLANQFPLLTNQFPRPQINFHCCRINYPRERINSPENVSGSASTHQRNNSNGYKRADLLFSSSRRVITYVI